MSQSIPKLYEELAFHIVDYLKTRYHTEAPHISILSPEYSVVARISQFRHRPTLEMYNEEGEGDFIPEVLADLLDPTRIRGHATHGVRALFRNFTTDSEILMKTTFYIRKAPPAEFKKVNVAFRLRENKLGLRVVIVDEQGEQIYDSDWLQKDFIQTPFRIIYAVGWGDIAREAANIISDALYPGAEIIELTDQNIVKALSTAEETKDGQEFLFQPSLARRRYASSREYFAVQNFLYEIEVKRQNNELEIGLVLRYIAPALINRIRQKFTRVDGELGFPTYIFIKEKDRRDRWSIHHLLEVESTLQWKDVQPAWGWIRALNGQRFAGLYNLIPIGTLAIENNMCNLNNGCLLLRDWHIDIERIYPIRKSKRRIDQSFQDILKEVIEFARKNGLGVNESALKEAFSIVVKALKNAYPQIVHLHEFQERTLYEGLRALLLEEHKAFVLQARTAGGKTLAFLLPILIYVVYAKLAGIDRDGVKALLFYPTTALQNDQAATIFKILWHINSELYPKHNVISLGMLHGHTPKRRGSSKAVPKEQELRLRCPLCGQRLMISWEIIPNTDILKEVIRCSNLSCRINNPNTPESKLLQTIVRGSRDAIYSSPPDLLIVNPDIINARLTLMGKEDPAALTILGKPAYVCARCGAIYDRKTKPRKCRVCDSKDLYFVRYAYPKIIVVDEAHLLRGAFGSQVAHVLTRLEQVIRRLNGLNENWRPIYFVSSATLNNPRARTQELIATEPNNIIEISAEPEEAEAESTLRIHVFIMPKLYSPEATTSRIVEAIYLDVKALVDSYRRLYNDKLEQLRMSLFRRRTPATLTFVNRISEANELLSFIRNFAYNIRSDGHTTDYREDRVRVEDEFSRGNLDIIVATSGLEVGVDFDRVDVGIIYGMPFYISDYTQRIGRIGRRQHCMIFNIFMPDKPIDHFYYKNWKLLSDGFLRDIHMRSEAYRINRENPEAIRRATQRAVLDMISTITGADKLLHLSMMAQNRKFAPEIMSALSNIESELDNYLRLALRIPNILQAVYVAKQFIDSIKHNVSAHLTLLKAIKKGLEASLRQLHSLRSLEPEVRYKFNPLGEERNRNMIYAFRHSLPGQVISYRSNFYIVDSFSGEHIFSSRERESSR